MRVFFGLGLSAAEAIALADWRERCVHCDGRAVPMANFHLTLAFLGELQPRRLDGLLSSADAVVSAELATQRQLFIDQVGYWSRPGIYWAGPSSWPDELTRLAGALRSLTQKFGARRERSAFQPHITLFRRCETAPPAPSAPPAIDITAGSVSLFESRQGREGVSYHPLAEWQ